MNLPRRIGAAHGWRWFTIALSMVRRQPVVFLGMGLFVAVVDTVLPIIGPLAVLIMGPAFLCGICVAADATARRQSPAFAQLFAVLVQSERRGEALKLCIPLVLGKLAAAMILGFALASQLARQGIKVETLQGHPDKLMALLVSEAMVPWLLVALAVVLFAWTVTALAIPRVAFSRESALAAISTGFRQVWQHFSAWIVAVLALFACLLIVVTVLYLTHLMLLVQLGFFTILYALLGPMLYAAWRDLGGYPPSDGPNQPPAPPRPPSPPPPSGVLEA